MMPLMFNAAHRVQLSAFADLFDQLQRDAAFFSVAKIPSRVDAKLVPLTSLKYLAELEANISGIAAVLCTPEIANSIPTGIGCAITANPVATAFHIHKALSDRAGYYWTDFATQIPATARVHPRAFVAELNVVIGEHSIIGPHATLHERSVIGANCYIGTGTVIGCEAFEVPLIDGRKQLHPQAGGVRIADHVVICSNSSVAKSSFPAFTEIGKGCVLDNHVHVAHDCILEPGCTITHGTLLAGRVQLEEGVYVGPNTSISNGIHVGKNAKLSIGSTVVKDVREGTRVTGNFAIEHAQFIRNLKRSVE
jgi:acyl-[acyl carrier protein]--UDP-N-acetylglucosamine O-acyltransferase